MSKVTDAVKAAILAKFENGDVPDGTDFSNLITAIQEAAQDHEHNAEGGSGSGTGDASQVAWDGGISGKPSTYAPSTHNHDDRYFTETEHLDESAGAGDAGKPIKLDAAGKVDSSMMVDHGDLAGLADDDHPQYKQQNTTAKARAYPNIQQLNLTHGVITKVTLDVENYDPSNAFAASRFTAKVAGYYVVSATVCWVSGSVVANKAYSVYLYKNGAVAANAHFHSAFTYALSCPISDVIYLDIDDYLELYARQNSGVNTVGIYNTTSLTYLSVHLLSTA